MLLSQVTPNQQQRRRVPESWIDDQEVGCGALGRTKEVSLVQCKKCGQENLNGALLCQRCGTTLKKTAVQHGLPNQSVASRTPGVFVLVAGALVLLGMFRPWLQTAFSSGEIPWFGQATFSFDISGWDIATGHGLTTNQGASHVEKYAVITFIGGILILMSAVWALATPLMRAAWVMATVGGVLAMVGCAWGWHDLNPFVAALTPVGPGNLWHYGAGWYMAMAGGIVGFITGMYAFRRSSQPSI